MYGISGTDEEEEAGLTADDIGFGGKGIHVPAGQLFAARRTGVFAGIATIGRCAVARVEAGSCAHSEGLGSGGRALIVGFEGGGVGTDGVLGNDGLDGQQARVWWWPPWRLVLGNHHKTEVPVVSTHVPVVGGRGECELYDWLHGTGGCPELAASRQLKGELQNSASTCTDGGTSYLG